MNGYNPEATRRQKESIDTKEWFLERFKGHAQVRVNKDPSGADITPGDYSVDAASVEEGSDGGRTFVLLVTIAGVQHIYIHLAVQMILLVLISWGNKLSPARFIAWWCSVANLPHVFETRIMSL